MQRAVLPPFHMGSVTDIGQSVQRSGSTISPAGVSRPSPTDRGYRDGHGKLVADAAGSVTGVGSAVGAAAVADGAGVGSGRAAAVAGFGFFLAAGFFAGGVMSAG